MPFEFEDTKPRMSNEEILDDLRRVAGADKTLTVRSYNQKGRFSSAVVKSRFRSWNSALQAAGLTLSHVRDVDDEELWNNLREVWIRLGRQPRRVEMTPPLSRMTHNPYVRRFGSWLSALKAFAVSNSKEASEVEIPFPSAPTPRGPRSASLRLRYIVMKRDRFRCAVCGRSPATNPGIELHIDHVAAWSRGGSTELGNLQTLCQDCNLGKSDLPGAEQPGS